jgi:hypothetical protein
MHLYALCTHVPPRIRTPEPTHSLLTFPVIPHRTLVTDPAAAVSCFGRSTISRTRNFWPLIVVRVLPSGRIIKRGATCRNVPSLPLRTAATYHRPLRALFVVAYFDHQCLITYNNIVSRTQKCSASASCRSCSAAISWLLINF